MSQVTLQSLGEEVAALRQHLAALAEKLARLEAAAAAAPAHVVEVPAAEAPEPAEEGISEETLAAISAAIAAFLGQRPHIRAIRLVGSPAWAQQGRVSIMASPQVAPQAHPARAR
jgi:methylmalonyl-CoA carboxyltransferase large subunit